MKNRKGWENITNLILLANNQIKFVYRNRSEEMEFVFRTWLKSHQRKWSWKFLDLKVLLYSLNIQCCNQCVCTHMHLGDINIMLNLIKELFLAKNYGLGILSSITTIFYSIISHIYFVVVGCLRGSFKMIIKVGFVIFGFISKWILLLCANCPCVIEII